MEAIHLARTACWICACCAWCEVARLSFSAFVCAVCASVFTRTTSLCTASSSSATAMNYEFSDSACSFALLILSSGAPSSAARSALSCLQTFLCIFQFFFWHAGEQ